MGVHDVTTDHSRRYGNRGVRAGRLASAVSRCGGLGVVSGVGIGTCLARRLQDGDRGGNYRRALAAFPVQDLAARILQQYYIEGGRKAGVRYKTMPVPSLSSHVAFDELNAAACFAETWLAKEGHSYPIGLNLLTKLQAQTLPSLLGAMLAGVDVVIMGAGIPVRVPGILDQFAKGEAAHLQVDVTGQAQGEVHMLDLDPARPARNARGRTAPPDFHADRVVCNAGGDAATAEQRQKWTVLSSNRRWPAGITPRRAGLKVISDRGEVVWGERDAMDPAGIKALGLPFWLAGARGSPEGLANALAVGASGVQVGTAFAFCRESAIRDDIKRDALALAQAGKLEVRSDPTASPTGFPFKVCATAGIADGRPGVYEAAADLRGAGICGNPIPCRAAGVGWRCAAEPVEQHVAKGGTIESTIGRKCLCSGLSATIGIADIAAGRHRGAAHHHLWNRRQQVSPE